MVADYKPNREICLPELLSSEVVPIRDPRLLAVRPASSIYFDMAKAFAKGIPPEDWYERGPDEVDWISRAKKFLVHLPINSQFCPGTNDLSHQAKSVAVNDAETRTECTTTKDAVVTATGCHLLVPGVTAAAPTEHKDSDSDDERISQVIQSCMEPGVVNVKIEPLEIDTEVGNVLGTCAVESPTVKSTMAVTEGKAQRLLKMKQSGISPDMLRRRLQKIEEKLSALRRSKTSTDVSETHQSAGTLASMSRTETDILNTERQRRASDEPGRSRVDTSSHRLQAVCTDGTIVGSRRSSYSFPLDLNVDIPPADHLHKTMSEPLTGSSSVHSNHAASVSRQPLNATFSIRHLQSPNELMCDPPHVGDVGKRTDGTCDQLWDQLPWYVGSLSLDTKWDSQFIESQAVRRTLLEVMRNWRVRKPLDLIVSGQLQGVPQDWTPMKSTWKTDHTVDCCWNSVLWYFGALLGEPSDPSSQQLMTSSTEEDAETNRDILPDDDDDDDDWWGIGKDQAKLPAVDPVEYRQKAGVIECSLPSSERWIVPHQASVEPHTAKPASKPTPVSDLVVLPSEKVQHEATLDGGRKSPSQSGSSRKEKLESASSRPSTSSQSSAKQSSEKRKRKHEDKKKTKCDDEPVSVKSTQSVKDSQLKEHDTKKERKKTAKDKEREKHPKKIKTHKQDVSDVKDKVKRHLESMDCSHADIASLLRLFVGSDEKKLALLSKAISSAKQFNSHKLTTSTSLHWAVALALLDENALDDNALMPSSLWSEQPPDGCSESDSQLNSSNSVATESSMKRVFDSISDFMNDILSGKSVSGLSDAKSAEAADKSSASHLDELQFSELENGSESFPVADKIKVEVDSECEEKTYVSQQVDPMSIFAEETDDVVFEEMKKIKVKRHSVDNQKFILPEENESTKVTSSQKVSDLKELRTVTESEHKQQKLETAGEIGKNIALESDEDADAKQLQKLSSDVGKALVSLRDEHSKLEDRKDARRHHNKKETAGTVDRETTHSSTSRQSSTKRKHGKSRHSEREKSKHGRHERKSSLHDRHKKTTSTSEKWTTRDRPLTSSFEAISDTELDTQTSSVNNDRMSRKHRSRARMRRTVADDKAKTDEIWVESTSNVGSMSDKSDRTVDNYEALSSVPSEKLPALPESTLQQSVTNASSGTLAHIVFRPSAIYKMANSATTPPVKTATTDMLLASRGPRFMQTFRRSQIAKRRSQRESQQTATGGKLLSTSHRPPNSMILSKPVVRPIGLSLEETLAALSTSAGTGQSDVSTLQSSMAEDSSTTVSSSVNLSALPSASCPVSSSTDVPKSPSKLGLISSAGDGTVDLPPVPPPPPPPFPTAAEDDSAAAYVDDDGCDSRTTSVAGSPPPDLSLLCGNQSSTNIDNRDASPSFSSVYSAMQAYSDLVASDQYFGQGDFGSCYWTNAYMPSYGAYGYESSMYNTAYQWYYGQAWNMMYSSSMLPVSSDMSASCDGSYGSYSALTPDGSFSPLPTSQQEPLSAWSMFSPPSAPYGAEPQFSSSALPEIPITNRLRAPPRLSSSDDEPVRPQKSPLLPVPVPSSVGIISPSNLPRFSASRDNQTGFRAPVGLQKKRFYVYSNNAQLKADVTVSILAHRHTVSSELLGFWFYFPLFSFLGCVLD